MFTIKYNATEEYLPVNPSPTVRGHRLEPIAKAKRHRFASEEAKAGAFAYDAKRDRAGWALDRICKEFLLIENLSFQLTPHNSSKKS